MKSTVIDLGDSSFNRSVQDFMERLLQSDLVGRTWSLAFNP